MPRPSIVRCLAALAVSLTLAGCGDSDAEQRKAFIAFLQTRVVDPPGIHLPRPSPDEVKSFGPYAKQYDILTDFSAGLDDGAKGLDGQFTTLSQLHTPGQLLANRDSFASVKAGIDRIGTSMSGALDKANAAHAALKQPDDLRVVFDKAFAKDVTVPAQAFQGMVPVFDAAMTADLKFIDYIAAHQAGIVTTGGMLQVRDAALLAPIQALQADVATTSAAIGVAGSKFQAMVRGQ